MAHDDVEARENLRQAVERKNTANSVRDVAGDVGALLAANSARNGFGDTGLLADYLTERQFAREIGVTLRTIRNWRSAGEGPPITRIGIRIFYARADCKKWLGRQRVEVA